MIISPSILSADFSNLQKDIIKLEKSSCPYIHVDVMDGHFVSNISFGPLIIKSIRPYSDKIFDVHLMISQPSKYVNAFIDAGADIISIHTEIGENTISILQEITAKKIKSGIVYNPDTNIEGIEKYFPYVDQIILMSVFPGFAGQKFIPETLDRGKKVFEKIQDFSNKTGKKIDLEIDGGVGEDNIAEIKKAGFNIAVAGSYIFKNSNFETQIQKLVNG